MKPDPLTRSQTIAVGCLIVMLLMVSALLVVLLWQEMHP